MTIRNVGIIGLGAIGRPMGRHLAAGGFGAFGFDPSEDACRQAQEVGITTFASPREVAERSEFVIVVVGFEHQVDAVLFADDGVLAGAQPGAVIGISSTVSPTYARELAVRLAPYDVRLLDMPTTRSNRAAESGNLLVMAGADLEVIEVCRPALDTFSGDVFRLGDFGHGQVGKMINNIILWACMAANDEGFRLGESLGVDQETMRAALKTSSAANFPLIEESDTRPIPWAEKDMIIAQREADQLALSIPLTGHVKELIKAFKARMNYATPKR